MAEDDDKASKKAIQEQKLRIQAEKEFGQSLGYAQQALMEQVKALKDQNGLVEGLVRSSKMLNDSTKQNVELKRDLASLYSTEVQAANDLILKRAMVQTQLQGDYAQYLAQYMIQKKIKDVNDPRLEGVIKELKQRQELNRRLEDERDLNEEIAAEIINIRGETESWKKGFDKILATAKEIAKDPKTLAFFMFNEGVKGLEKMHGTFEEMHKMGLTAGQAMEATFSSMDITSMDWWLGLNDVKGVTQGIVEEYGNVNAISKETKNNLAEMAHKFGISGEEAAKLNAAMSRIPGETSESAESAMKMTGELAAMQGIAPGKIMKDMAQNTGEMARAGAKGAKEFGKTAIELHKMGVEISTASKQADSLLDFESSINSQMEASVLLGREINLDKARELALNNDIAGMTEEIGKNIGGAAEFGKMNRLEQDALAKSVGMSVEELTKQMDAQEENNKYFGEGAGLTMNTFGTLMQYGGAAAGFFKENGMLLMTTIQLLSSENAMKLLGNVYDKIKVSLGLLYQGTLWVINGILNSRLLIQTKEFVMDKAKVAFGYVQLGLTQARAGAEMLLNNTKVGMWLKEKAHWAAEKIHMGWKMAQERLGIGMKAAAATQTAASTAASAGASAASGAGAAAGLGGLATGLTAMGTPQVLFGAFNLIAAAPGLVLMVAGIPFLIAISLLGIPAGAGLSGLATGLTAMSNPMLLMAGANLSVFALASVIGVAGIPFLAMIALVGIPAGAGLTALGAGLTAMANPAVAIGAAILSGLAISLGAGIMMMGIGIGIAAAGLSLMFAELAKMPIEQMLLLPVALLGIGAGLGALAVASFFAFPGLLLASWALGGFAAVLALMQPIMEMGGLLSLAEGLTALAGSAGGLSEVSAAVLGIGGGLGLMAMAGLAALPIIGALMGLAAVAPALGTLGSMFGGGGDGGGEDDKMQLIADKLDQLIAVASKGGEVNLDGRKVGQVLKLGLNTSNVR